MLYLIGLGLGFKDLSVRALEVLKKCSEVYLEGYTSTSDYSIEDLQELVKKKVRVLDRKQVEMEKPFLERAKEQKVALLVYGDALSATTHTEILLDAKQKKINTKVLHAGSVLTAVGMTGLSLYKFGRATTIPIWRTDFKPESFFDTFEQNQKIGAHTLFLLEMEPNGGEVDVERAVSLLFNIAKKRNSPLFNKKTLCVVCSKLATKKQIIKKGTAKEITKGSFPRPACLIVPSKLADYEREALNRLAD